MSDQSTGSPGRQAWRKFRKDRLAMLGLAVIVIAVLVSLLGSNIRPDQTPWADRQILGIKHQPPGFRCTMLVIPDPTRGQDCTFFTNMLFGGCEDQVRFIPVHRWSLNTAQDTLVVEQYTGHNELLEGEQLVVPMAVLSGFASGSSMTAPLHGEAKVHASLSERKFLLGTDGFGRDMTSRLMAGTIISLSVGAISVLISLLIGIVLGAVAGFFRAEKPTTRILGRSIRWPVDDLIMWLVNVVWSIPTLLLVIAITLALGKGVVQVFIAVGLTMWVEVARVVRGQVLSVREMEFVEAAKALGFTNRRIIFKHILPNVLSPVIVIAAANFATAILMEAGLSFLGIGAQLPMVSWGSMIRDHYPYITSGLPHLAILPGLCIMLLVLAFTWVGNGLRDALDTRS